MRARCLDDVWGGNHESEVPRMCGVVTMRARCLNDVWGGNHGSKVPR